MTLPGQITGVHTVGVPVTDQERAIDFYMSPSRVVSRGGRGFCGRRGGAPRRQQS